jgi:hypothetical protein
MKWWLYELAKQLLCIESTMHLRPFSLQGVFVGLLLTTNSPSLSYIMNIGSIRTFYSYERQTNPIHILIHILLVKKILMKTFYTQEI